MLIKLLLILVLIFVIPRTLTHLFEFFEVHYTIYAPYILWLMAIILFLALLTKKSLF